MFRRPPAYSRIGCTAVLSICIPLTVSCDDGQQRATPVAARMADSDTRVRSDSGETSGAPIAKVNGIEIDRREFVRRLLESHGLALLQRWMMRDLARQESERLGIKWARSDVEAEYDLTLREGLSQAKDAAEWTSERRDRFMDELIRLRGWSRHEMNLVMERQAIIRKIASKQVTMDDAQLEEAFARKYGEKAVVRHIELAAPRWWEGLKQRLDVGVDFAELVASYSQNRASRENGGLLPPFTANDRDIPGAFRAVAFELQPGQVSNPITFEGSLHVLKLEERIPAGTVKLEDVRDQLRVELTKELVEHRMAELSAALLQNCRMRIHDPILRKQYRQRLDEGEIAGPTLEP